MKMKMRINTTKPVKSNRRRAETDAPVRGEGWGSKNDHSRQISVRARILRKNYAESRNAQKASNVHRDISHQEPETSSPPIIQVGL